MVFFGGWLSRFKLIRLRRISLATLPRYGRMGGRRERTRGECGFSSLVKQNKKAKICFVIHIAGEKKLLFYIYAVIVKQIFYKRSTNYYVT